MSTQRGQETVFSDDSLGESTRSLLSPVLGYCDTADLDNELSEGSLSLSSDNESETDICNKKNEQTPHSVNHRTTKAFGRRNAPYSSGSASVVSQSGSQVPSLIKTGTKNHKSTSSTRSTARKPSPTNRSYTYSDSFTSESCHDKETKQTKDSELSPWEKWLVMKTLEDREKHRRDIVRQQREKEKIQEVRREKEKTDRRAEEERKRWVEQKNRMERERRRALIQQKQLQLEMKEQSQRDIEEKSKQKYEEWLTKKRAETAEKRQLKEQNERERKEREVERRMRSEEEYEKWQKQLRSRPRSVYNSFGYTGGMLTGYYEWGSYPAPSYVNPIPWVHSGPKKSKGERRGKKAMQPPSPPLLFRDIEQRERGKR